MQISLKSIEEVALQSFRMLGISDESGRIISDTILFANKRGVATHGIGRLPLYIKKIQAGHLNPKDEIETVMDTRAVAVIDAHNCMGQVAAYKALKLAISKAQQYGISAVGVRNSNNFGTAGFFGDLAARAGMAAMIYANAAPAIAPTGGTKKIFGTNPICYAFPGEEGADPVLLDMATTVVARGKIRLAAKNGERIPLDWAIGPDGAPTDNPDEALKGSLLPIAGYKGYGLSMFVDLLAGLLTSSAHAGGVKTLGKMDEDSGNGHLFILIDTMNFLKREDLNKEMKSFREKVKQCGPEDKIYMPGEKEYSFRTKNPRTVEINEKQVDEINDIISTIGVKARLQHIS